MFLGTQKVGPQSVHVFTISTACHCSFCPIRRCVLQRLRLYKTIPVACLNAYVGLMLYLFNLKPPHTSFHRVVPKVLWT